MEMVLDILIVTVVVAAIGFWLGWHARGITIYALFSDDPQKIIDILEKIKQINQEQDLHTKVVKAIGVEVEPELVNGQWYAYTKDQGQFVGQGATIEEALEQAKTRFPGKSFWCNRPQEPSQTS